MTESKNQQSQKGIENVPRFTKGAGALFHGIDGAQTERRHFRLIELLMPATKSKNSKFKIQK